MLVLGSSLTCLWLVRYDWKPVCSDSSLFLFHRSVEQTGGCRTDLTDSPWRRVLIRLFMDCLVTAVVIHTQCCWAVAIHSLDLWLPSRNSLRIEDNWSDIISFEKRYWNQKKKSVNADYIEASGAKLKYVFALFWMVYLSARHICVIFQFSLQNSA